MVMQSSAPQGDSLLKRDLENDPAVIYVLDRDLRILFCNKAWDRFAAGNGGVGLERHRQLGRCVMDAVPAPLRPFFEEGYGRVRASRQAWEHRYECSSPTVYRAFHMAVYPAPRGEGLVVVNSLAVERPHDPLERIARLPDETAYEAPDGTVTMCCHCRRTSRLKETAVWDWVPAYVENPAARVSHGMCSVCLNLFYPEFGSEQPA